MEKDELRRWLAGRRAAQDRERELLRGSPEPAAAAINGALDLIDWAGEMLGWPLPEDAVVRREDQIARHCWCRLYARWPA